jgi:hypothetical protein
MRKLRPSEKRQRCIDNISLFELELMEIDLKEKVCEARKRLFLNELKAEGLPKLKDESLIEANTGNLCSK